MPNPKTKSRLAAIPRLISRPALLEMLGIGPSALHDWSINRDFPAAIELGPPGARSAKIVWVESEVLAWIESRPRRVLGVHGFRGRLSESKNDAPPPRKRGRTKPLANATTESVR